MAVRELGSTPSMLRLFGRAGVALLPGASMLPFVAGAGGSIPDLTLTLNGIEVDRGRLAAYDRVCGFSFSDVLPVTYPHMLAFPLHPALMTDGSFPFQTIGLVHIATEITQHRPIRAGERLAQRVLGTSVVPHARGRQFTLRPRGVRRRRGRVGGELDEPAQGWRQRSGRGPWSPDPPTSELPASATWRLPGNLGRRYGSVSGDLNPIHVHPPKRPAVRLPVSDRARDVDQGALPGGARAAAPRRADGGGRLPQADPAAGDGRVRLAGGR